MISNFVSQSALHVAIIMDGNGRWATRQGLPRAAGHRAGADAVHRAVEAASQRDIRQLTLYAFSSDNWRRPLPEVLGLFNLFEEVIRDETANCVSRGVRLSVIGRRDRLPPRLRAAIKSAERTTERGRRLHLRIAIDYSARAAIGDGGILPDVDLLIRTGGERRLSDFLLWECAYAELLFLDTMWPEFTAEELDRALGTFHARERRFGGLPGEMAG
ncbi:MAG TPA: polyprenyl diphosphate synthase [Gemmatimonadales bacterium]|nr:polyprenyl diphosphate synthase [Gemmatimonadales bacterium]